MARCTSPFPEQPSNANAIVLHAFQLSKEPIPSIKRPREAPFRHRTSANSEVAGIKEHLLSQPHTTRPALRTSPKRVGESFINMGDLLCMRTASSGLPGRVQDLPGGT